MVSVTELFNRARGRLQSVMTEGEADAAARIIFEDVAGYGRNCLWMNGEREVLPSTEEKINCVVTQVEQGTPVQYAVGKALFMGNYFKVNRSTLIPRPETAGLVDIITDAYGSRSDLKVLDIGTGSGCIAVELAKALPFSEVTGWDISDEALATAAVNAKTLKAVVNFEKQDVLASELPTKEWDIIVSNPPYVLDSEKDSMEPHVLNYEPHSALFVPDSDPLRFYKAIAKYAAENLVTGGGLFFEINRDFAKEMKQLLESYGFANVQCLRDYKGNWRYASGIKK